MLCTTIAKCVKYHASTLNVYTSDFVAAFYIILSNCMNYGFTRAEFQVSTLANIIEFQHSEETAPHGHAFAE